MYLSSAHHAMESRLVGYHGSNHRPAKFFIRVICRLSSKHHCPHIQCCCDRYRNSSPNAIRAVARGSGEEPFTSWISPLDRSQFNRASGGDSIHLEPCRDSLYGWDRNVVL